MTGVRLAGAAVFVALVSSAYSAADDKAPLTIGETFTLRSDVLNETRRINVYTPGVQPGAAPPRLPTLYMLDGGIEEDFLHVAGLVQVLVGNGGMRPFRLVGIENTQRRRDLTGPTNNAKDKSIAKEVGGSAKFRHFLSKELKPEIDRRFPTTRETAIVGESLAGLFIVETFLVEPELFDRYIAVDPSLWWNDAGLVESAKTATRLAKRASKTLYIACSNEPSTREPSQKLFAHLQTRHGQSLAARFAELNDETHATVFHPAALAAFRTVFKPQKPEGRP